jgi:hypothetical protein
VLGGSRGADTGDQDSGKKEAWAHPRKLPMRRVRVEGPWV